MKYAQAYPALQCDFCREVSDEVVVYHQGTMYQGKESNYAAACPTCKILNDEYWAEMWEEYYAQRM